MVRCGVTKLNLRLGTSTSRYLYSFDCVNVKTSATCEIKLSRLVLDMIFCKNSRVATCSKRYLTLENHGLQSILSFTLRYITGVKFLLLRILNKSCKLVRKLDKTWWIDGRWSSHFIFWKTFFTPDGFNWGGRSLGSTCRQQCYRVCNSCKYTRGRWDIWWRRSRAEWYPSRPIV